MNFKMWNAGSGRSEGVVHVVKNADTVVLAAGMPAVFVFNGTDDGLAVVSAATAGANKLAVGTAGVIVKDIQPGTLGNVQVYGFNRHTKILRATRAASTDNWASNTTAYATNDILIADTNGNWVKGAAAANDGNPKGVIVAVTVGSFASRPATNNGANAASATAFYEGISTFIRMM